jgi:hypothetical protein
MTVIGLERTMRSVGIHLARPQTGDEGVPVVIRAVPLRIEWKDVRGLCRIAVIEQQQLDERRTL